MADVLERIGERRATQAVTDAIPRCAAPRACRSFEGQSDPHVWFDVELWAYAVRQVRDTLSELDPDSAELYRANAAAYLAELEELDAYVAAQAARVPARAARAHHGARRLRLLRQGVRVRGARPAGDLDRRPRQARATSRSWRASSPSGGSRAIFVESSVSPRTIQAVREAVRSRGFDVQVGRPLFSDAMGDEGTPEGTYVGMVRHNVDTIVEGLSG